MLLNSDILTVLGPSLRVKMVGRNGSACGLLHKKRKERGVKVRSKALRWEAASYVYVVEFDLNTWTNLNPI